LEVILVQVRSLIWSASRWTTLNACERCILTEHSPVYNHVDINNR
jgi:hypothetical protein